MFDHGKMGFSNPAMPWKELERQLSDQKSNPNGGSNGDSVGRQVRSETPEHPVKGGGGNAPNSVPYAELHVHSHFSFLDGASSPEELVNEKFQNPMIVTATGSLTEFNITIDNGISHMLSFSNNRNYIFYNESSDKFKPASDKNIIFDCKLNNTKISSLKFDQIIEFVNNN